MASSDCEDQVQNNPIEALNKTAFMHAFSGSKYIVGGSRDGHHGVKAAGGQEHGPFS